MAHKNENREGERALQADVPIRVDVGQEEVSVGDEGFQELSRGRIYPSGKKSSKGNGDEVQTDDEVKRTDLKDCEERRVSA